jgi:hypothetical protein
MRSPTRTVLGLVLLALAFPGAAHAGDEGILVRATANSYVDITIHEAVDVVESEITFKTRGSYAAFYLLPHFTTHEPVGALWSPRLGARGGSERLVPLGSGWELTPGLYRLYVISAQPVDVFIPMPGSAFRAYRTNHHARASVQQSGFRVGSSDDVREQRLPARASSRRSLVTAVSYASSSALTGVDQSTVCLVAARKSCAPTVLPALRMPTSSARSEQSAIYPVGRYEGVFRLARTAQADGVTTVATFLLVLNT